MKDGELPTRAPLSADLVVGFDLDMTLVDARAGVHATLLALSAETGVFIDPDVVVARLGPPLEQEMAEWFPAASVAEASDRYLALFETHGLDGALALPGAEPALQSVADASGRSVVVTARYEPHARALLAATGLVVDRVIGWRYGARKGEALAEERAAVYVGDSPADVVGARTSGAVAVAVASGPHDAGELRASGADVVLASLAEFPTWFAGWRRRQP
jgi:phosphoglycolate phosphatase